MTRRDYTYGSMGDCTITFDRSPPEGRIKAPPGSMHLNLLAGVVYLKVDGNETTGWVASTGSGGGITDGDYGDITISGGGTQLTINDGVVTFDKVQDLSGPGKVLGRLSLGPGDVEEIPYALSALSDVALTTPAADDLLAFNGTKWINRKQTYVTDGGNF